MKNSLRKTGYVLLPLIVFYIVHDVAKYILMFGLSFLADPNAKTSEFVIANRGIFSGIISILYMLAGAFSVLLLMKSDYYELSIWDYLNLTSIDFYRKDRIHSSFFGWILIILQSIFAAIGLNILISLSGLIELSNTYSQTSSNQYSLPIWLGIILYGLVSPAVEELLFRTVIFGRMKRSFPYVVSVLVTSLFFGLYHQNLVQCVYGGLMGILMCLACEYLHTVVGAFVFHSVANLTIYFLSMGNVLVKLTSIPVCIITCIGLVITIALEMYYSWKSDIEFGKIKGVGRVGCFSYYEE